MAATMPVEKKNQWPKVGIENCSKQSLSSLCGCGVVFRDGVTKWCLLLLCSLVSTYLFCENVFFFLLTYFVPRPRLDTFLLSCLEAILINQVEPF